jgi:uroporphyrinogen-III synthase
MKLLLTKSLPSLSLDLLRSHGLHVNVIEALKITPEQVTNVPEGCDIWIVSSRNSLNVVEKFKDFAPRRIYVVGKWLEEQIKKIVGKSDTKSFKNMKMLASELNQQSFSNGLYFCADNHREELEEGLRARGKKITKIITHRSQLTFPVLTEKYDAIFVFSPRSAESILTNNHFDSSVIFLCIGSTTEHYLHDRHITNTFCATYPDSTILMNEFISSKLFNINTNLH